MLMIVAKDLAAGDYSPIYGTIETIAPFGTDLIRITYKNGTVDDVNQDEEVLIDQGGTINRARYGS